MMAIINNYRFLELGLLAPGRIRISPLDQISPLDIIDLSFHFLCLDENVCPLVF